MPGRVLAAWGSLGGPGERGGAGKKIKVSATAWGIQNLHFPVVFQGFRGWESSGRLGEPGRPRGGGRRWTGGKKIKVSATAWGIQNLHFPLVFQGFRGWEGGGSVAGREGGGAENDDDDDE